MKQISVVAKRNEFLTSRVTDLLGSKGINIIGMRRQGYSKQVVTEVVDFFRTMEASALSPKSFGNAHDVGKNSRPNFSIAGYFPLGHFQPKFTDGIVKNFFSVDFISFFPDHPADHIVP